jgi:hypothetical protein
MGGNVTQENVGPNATLIAAAPELLEALRVANAAMCGELRIPVARAHEIVAAAIAKAEGRA